MRFNGTGKDGHTFKILGETESVSGMSYRNGAGTGFTECFGIGEGYIRLKNTATASLPSSPDSGALVYDSTTNTVKFYNGSTWASVGAVSTYTEGTWTANVQDSSASDGEGQAVTSTNTTYTRIGNVVNFSGEISVTDKGTLSGSIVYISGLPFTAKSDGGGLTVTHMSNLGTVGFLPTGVIDGGTTALLYYPDGSGGVTNLAVADLSTSTTMKFYGSYEVA